MIWRPIPGFPLYEASEAGQIRRIGQRRNLRGTPNDGGYLRVWLVTGDGRRVRHPIHTLVLLTFVGPRPSPRHHGAHVRTNDKGDNSIDNLQWKLPRDNEADKRSHGTAPRGGRHAWRPNAARVQAIREQAALKVSFSQIAREHGLHRSSVARIVKRQRRAST